MGIELRLAANDRGKNQPLMEVTSIERLSASGLLSFFQCVAGMILSTLSYDFVIDGDREPENREEIFRYYGTFTRATLTMFEILFGNWGPPARILVENVSEWFAPVFLGLSMRLSLCHAERHQCGLHPADAEDRQYR